LFLPPLLGMKRISSDLLPRLIRDLPVMFYRWNLPGSGIANAPAKRQQSSSDESRETLLQHHLIRGFGLG